MDVEVIVAIYLKFIYIVKKIKLGGDLFNLNVGGDLFDLKVGGNSFNLNVGGDLF